MKILVTGGAGFIGSYFVKLLLKLDASVSIINLDKLTYCGDISRLSELKGNPRYQFIEGDICDAEIVKYPNIFDSIPEQYCIAAHILDRKVW